MGPTLGCLKLQGWELTTLKALGTLPIEHRGPNDNINTRILHSGAKVQDKGSSKTILVLGSSYAYAPTEGLL